MGADIYRSDPQLAPDSEFVPGELSHLVVGNRGRLLDARRTPIKVIAVAPDVGAFEVEIGAFEDAGAHWELALQDIRRFQFARGGALAPARAVAELERAATRFDQELVVDCDSARRAESLRRIAGERQNVRRRFAAGTETQIDLERCIAEREGDERLFALLETTMAAQGVSALEQRFAAAFVSNPNAGEFVKGHAIVLAELGLCPYRGQVVRNPATFTGQFSKARRADHLIARLAFTQELWSSLGHEAVTLYRGMATEGPWQPPAPSSFVSATFAREVALAHFEGGPTTKHAALLRQQTSITRLVMTFLETREMSDRFNEAEAVLIADRAQAGF